MATSIHFLHLSKHSQQGFLYCNLYDEYNMFVFLPRHGRTLQLGNVVYDSEAITWLRTKTACIDLVFTTCCRADYWRFQRFWLVETSVATYRDVQRPYLGTRLKCPKDLVKIRVEMVLVMAPFDIKSRYRRMAPCWGCNIIVIIHFTILFLPGNNLSEWSKLIDFVEVVCQCNLLWIFLRRSSTLIILEWQFDESWEVTACMSLRKCSHGTRVQTKASITLYCSVHRIALKGKEGKSLVLSNNMRRLRKWSSESGAKHINPHSRLTEPFSSLRAIS